MLVTSHNVLNLVDVCDKQPNHATRWPTHDQQVKVGFSWGNKGLNVFSILGKQKTHPE